MHLVKQACLSALPRQSKLPWQSHPPSVSFSTSEMSEMGSFATETRCLRKSVLTPDSDRTGSWSSYLIASAVMKGIEVGMPAEGRHDNAQKPTPPLCYNRSESRTGRDRLIRNHQRLSKCFCGRRLSRPLRYPNGLGFVRLIIPDLGCAPRRRDTPFDCLLQPAFRFILISSTIFMTAGCATIAPRNVLPQASSGQIELEGFHNIRFWGDASAKDIQAIMMAEVPKTETRLSLAVERHQPVSNLLAISGGAEDGAFGAGLLVGWSDTGTRPVFDLVTGVSSGALIAPFAFLGREHDSQLREIFTKYGRKDIFTYNVPSLLEGSALVDDAPLARLIEKYVDDEFLREIARERIKGRILLIGTTNLDTQRPVLWDMGRIAMSNNRARWLSSARYCWHRRPFPGFSRQSEFRCGLGDRIMTSYMSMAASPDRSLSLHRYFRLFRTTNDREDLQQNRAYSLSEMEKSIPNGNPSRRMFCPLRSVQSPRL